MDAKSSTMLLGRWGEAKAAEYLKKNGYSVTGMNYHTRFGELDVIAEDRQYLAFVEVKLRRSDAFASGREYVDRRKQERLILAAQHWLSEHGSKKQPRFDVIEIYAPEGMKTVAPVIIHIPNAFQLS